MRTDQGHLDSIDHHVPSQDQLARIQANRRAYKAVLRVVLSTTPASPDRDLAIQQLRSSMMFANAAVVLERT